MKNERQFKILQIIAREDIRTQEELLSALRMQGYAVTQATVSRDIRELNLQKVQSPRGGHHYAVLSTPPPRDERDAKDKYEKVLAHVLVSALPAANLAVLKTLSGTAGAAAAALEMMEFAEIVGTLAGDDTLLCVFADTRQAFHFCREINTKFIAAENGGEKV